MDKYISILLAVILCASLLVGCGGSGKSVQEPAAQPEETKMVEAEEDAAQADAARDSAQAVADTAANSGAYLVCVMDTETMSPIQGVQVQLCSDSMCWMGKTDENGLASFEVDPGTYTVHITKAPEGYVKSEEEFTLDKDNREAAYHLSKE